MATLRLVINDSNTAVDTPEDFYTSPESGAGTVITSFTVSNNSNVNATYSAYIFDLVTQQIIKDKIVVWGEVDLGIGIVNQLIPPGSILKLESSATGSLFFNVTGREL